MPTIHLVDPKTLLPRPNSDLSNGLSSADVVATFVTEKTKKKKTPIAAVLGGKVVGLDSLLPEEEEPTVEFLLPGDPRALPVMRHSAAHIMARAVMRLFKGVELAFGPTVGEGFYYDMRAKEPITEEDLPKIEKEMRKIIAEDEAFERVEVDREQAIEIVRDLDSAAQGRAH